MPQKGTKKRKEQARLANLARKTHGAPKATTPWEDYNPAVEGKRTSQKKALAKLTGNKDALFELAPPETQPDLYVDPYTIIPEDELQEFVDIEEPVFPKKKISTEDKRHFRPRGLIYKKKRDSTDPELLLKQAELREMRERPRDIKRKAPKKQDEDFLDPSELNLNKILPLKKIPINKIYRPVKKSKDEIEEIEAGGEIDTNLIAFDIIPVEEDEENININEEKNHLNRRGEEEDEDEEEEDEEYEDEDEEYEERKQKREGRKKREEMEKQRRRGIMGEEDIVLDSNKGHVLI